MNFVNLGKSKTHLYIDRRHYSSGFDWKLCKRTALLDSMIERGDAVPIIVAPGSLRLTITPVSYLDLSICGVVRIDDINLDCTFHNKISSGDVIVTVDGERVLTVGTDRSRELIIIIIQVVKC